MIYHVVLFLGFVVLAMADEVDQKLDVQKGSKHFDDEWYECAGKRPLRGFHSWFGTLWHACIPEQLDLLARLLCNEKSEKIIGIRLTVFLRTTATYKIVSFDRNMDEKQLMELVCKSIIYEDKWNYRQGIVRYYSGGKWLCELYSWGNKLLRHDTCAAMDEENRKLAESRLALISGVTKVVVNANEEKYLRCTKEGKRFKSIFSLNRGWHQCKLRDNTLRATFLCRPKEGGVCQVGIQVNNNGGGIYKFYEVSYGNQPVDEKLLEAACEGFKKEINNKYQTFTVSFYNDKAWWCDVYNGDGTFLRLDKCDVIAEETSWLEDEIPYKSATLFEMVKNNYEDECPVIQELHEICKKNRVIFKAKQICLKSQWNTRDLRIVMSYQGIDLKDFVVIPSSRTQNMEDGMEKSCRLFNVQVQDNGSRIRAQYFYTGVGMKRGVWKCMEFNKKGNGFEALDYDNGKTGVRNEIQQCLKFNDYKLPLV